MEPPIASRTGASSSAAGVVHVFSNQLQCLLIWYMRGAAISCAHSSLFVRSLLMGRYCCRYRSTNRMSSEFPGPVCWRDCGQRQPCASLHSSPRLSCPEAAASPPSHVHGGRGYLGGGFSVGRKGWVRTRAVHGASARETPPSVAGGLARSYPNRRRWRTGSCEDSNEVATRYSLYESLTCV